MKELAVKLNSISDKYAVLKRKAKQKAINDFFSKKFDTKSVAWTGNSIEVDGYKVKFNIDMYLNITCHFSGSIPPNTLGIMRQILTEFIEQARNGYKYRTGTGLFIQYFKEYGSKMSVHGVKKLLALDDALPRENEFSGFRAWLLSDDYTTGGNLNSYCKIKRSALI